MNISPISSKWQSMKQVIDKHPQQNKINVDKKFKKLFFIRLLSENSLLFLLQYIGLMFTTLSLSPSCAWLATGTACGFVFLRGYFVLPGIWLGSVAAYVATESGLLLACQCASLHALQAFLLLWISHRFIGPTLIFHQLKTFIKFIAYSSLLTAAVSFALVKVCYSSIHYPATSLQLGLLWWLADINGILLFSCALVTWDTYCTQLPMLHKLNKLLLLLSYGLLLFLIISLTLSKTMASITTIGLSITSILFFISLIYGWCGTVTGLYIWGFLMSGAMVFNAPIFSFGIPIKSLTVIAWLLYLTAILCLFISVIKNRSSLKRFT